MKKGCLIAIIIFAILSGIGMILGSIQNSSDRKLLEEYFDQTGNEEASIELINLFTEDFDYQNSKSLIGIKFDRFRAGINIPDEYSGIEPYETFKQIDEIQYDEDILDQLKDDNKYTRINSAIIMAAKNNANSINTLLEHYIQESDSECIKGFTYAISALLKNNYEIEVDEKYLDQLYSKYRDEIDSDIRSNYTIVLALLGHEQIFNQVVSELDNHVDGDDRTFYLLELFKVNQIVGFENKETLEKLHNYYNDTSDRTIERLLISLYKGFDVAYYYKDEQIKDIYLSISSSSLSKRNLNNVTDDLIEQFEEMGFNITKKKNVDLTINIYVNAQAVEHVFKDISTGYQSESFSETIADVRIVIYDKNNNLVEKISGFYNYDPESIDEGAYSTKDSAPYEKSIFPAYVNMSRQLFGEDYVWLLISRGQFSDYSKDRVRFIANNDIASVDPAFEMVLNLRN